MAHRKGRPGGRFADFQARAAGLGLVEPARQLDVFQRLPASHQEAYWRDLAAEVDDGGRDQGQVV